MTLYAQQNLGASISELAITDDQQDEAIRSHERGATVPTVLVPGLVWISTSNPAIQAADLSSALVSPASHAEAALLRRSSDWLYLMDTRHPQLNAGGTVKLTQNLDCGTKALTNLGPSTGGTNAARRVDVLLKDGTNPATANISMGGNRLTNLGAPSAATDAVRKQDLDAAGSISSQQFVHAGSITDPTYLLTHHPLGDGATIIRSFIQTTRKPRVLDISMFGSAVRSDNNDRQGWVEAQLRLSYAPPVSDPGGPFRHGLGYIRFNQFPSSGPDGTAFTGLLGVHGDTPRFGGVRWKMNQYIGSVGSSLLKFRLSVEWFHGNYTEGPYVNASGLLIYIEDNNPPLHKLTFSNSTSGTGQLILNVLGWD